MFSLVGSATRLFRTSHRLMVDPKPIPIPLAGKRLLAHPITPGLWWPEVPRELWSLGPQALGLEVLEQIALEPSLLMALPLPSSLVVMSVPTVCAACPQRLAGLPCLRIESDGITVGLCPLYGGRFASNVFALRLAA